MDSKLDKKIDLIKQEKLFNNLDDKYKNLVINQTRLSFQDLRTLVIMITDLIVWNEDLSLLDDKIFDYSIFKNYYDGLKAKPYRLPKEPYFKKSSISKEPYPKTILGKCPVASEKTRCCNLYTLDTAQGCGFSCAYCAIPTFYGQDGNVRLPSNLAEILDNLSIDKDKFYHIGTGQAGDSLLYTSKEEAILLSNFARKNSNIILEFKSKSSNIEPFLQIDLPKNMVFTWSLNVEEVISTLEGGTANLSTRLNSAKQMVDKGVKVGFHIHPIVPFENYHSSYANLCREIEKNFTTHDIVMISMGTLTFSKRTIKYLRESSIATNLLRLPLVESASKYSISLATKQEMFSHVFKSFSKAYRDQIFFYLCMEDQSLWMPCLEKEYLNNDLFEVDMLESYRKKMGLISA